MLLRRTRTADRFLLASLLVLLASTSLLAQHPLVAPVDPLSPDPQSFDVIHYDLELDLSEAPDPVAVGRCAITIVWTDTLEPIFRFNLRDLVIDSVGYRAVLGPDSLGAEVRTVNRPRESNYHHQVHPIGGVVLGDTAVVTVFYHGTMTDEFGSGTWGGVSSSRGVLYAMGVGFTNNYVSTTQHWMPCYDHPSDKATFAATFTIPDGSAVASNGLLVSRVDNPDETESWRWEHVYPAATYLLTFAVADYVTIEEMTETDVPVVVYTLPQDSLKTGETFALLPEMVDWFAEKFGDYPFEKVGYVNTPQGAMEHQTMVSFPTFVSQRGDSLNLTGAHELAHQWFGNLVSPVDFRHVWLTESFATFCEALWQEREGGFTGYLAGLNSDLIDYLNSVSLSEGILPLYDFSREAPSTNYPGTIYLKGSVVVGMLRYELGDSLFFASMRRYLERFAYATATTEDLQQVLEESAGRSLDLFFEQWVRRAGWPIFGVFEREAEGDRTEIGFVQLQDGPTYSDVPVELRILTNNGTIDEIIRIDSASQSFFFDVPFADVRDASYNTGPSLRTLAEFETEFTPGVYGRGNDASGLSIRFDPTTDRIRVERTSSAPIARDITIRVFDAEGVQVASDTVTNLPATLEIGRVPSGYYLVDVAGTTEVVLVVR